MKALITRTIFLLFSLTVLFGCSGRSIPTLPNGSFDPNTASYEYMPTGVSETDMEGNPIAGYGALGVFHVSVDPDTLTGEIHSLRSAGSEDVLEVVDITNFLQIAPCTDCVKIDSVEINVDGNLIVNIGIKHPFPVGNPLQPISGRNRADLHVFNIEGLVVANASTSDNFSSIGQTVSGFQLLNADGYSAYLDNALDTIFSTTATIHPYVLHFDDYTSGNYNPGNPMGFASVTDPPPSGNLVMAMGCDFDIKPYVFVISDGEDIDFIYAVGCTYAVSSDTKSQRFQPVYRVPQHLKKAASEVSVRIVSNNLAQGDPSSDATIAIDVVDINHGVAVGTALDEMRADSSVSSIKLEIPGVLSGVKDVPLVNIGGGGHGPSDLLTYEVTIQNEQSALLGIYPCLVKVTDAYPVGLNLNPLLSGMDGIERVGPTQNPLEGLFAISEFATYQTFEIEVTGVPNVPPVAILTPESPSIGLGGTVNFNGTTSYDTDGMITTYEFDFIWDGVEANFVADVTNATGLATSAPYNTQGSYIAGLRVTDNLGAQAYDSSNVTVSITSCPIAPYAGGTFTLSLSYLSYILLSYSSDPNWRLNADVFFDLDILSNNQIVCVYSCGTASYLYNGSLRRVGTTANYDYVIVDGDYPGYRVTQIDADSTDKIVMVTSDIPHATETTIPVGTRNSQAHTYFRVCDPFVGSASEQQVTVGTRIAAVDIDENDDVWVLDINNVMRKYEKANSYAEDTSASFDLDVVTSNAFSGDVYDFAIDFYNEAFFILTTGSDATKVNLWRIECDGVYNSTINSHPNPLVDVFNDPIHPITHTADIAIDNLSTTGTVLSGQQDSQIVIGANWLHSPSLGGRGMVTRVDSELNQRAHYVATTGYGLSSFCFDQDNNMGYGWVGDTWADAWIGRWPVPAGWY